jgi:hypothetical protein
MLIIGAQAEWPLWLGNAFLTSILLLVSQRMWPILIAAAFAAFILNDIQTNLTVRFHCLAHSVWYGRGRHSRLVS